MASKDVFSIVPVRPLALCKRFVRMRIIVSYVVSPEALARLRWLECPREFTRVGSGQEVTEAGNNGPLP